MWKQERELLELRVTALEMSPVDQGDSVMESLISRVQAIESSLAELRVLGLASPSLSTSSTSQLDTEGPASRLASAGFTGPRASDSLVSQGLVSRILGSELTGSGLEEH